MPHARVRNIDIGETMKMSRVVAVMTADDLPKGVNALTNEPKFVGKPILTVTTVDETTTINAIEKICVDLEELPYVIDPLKSLYPGGPDAVVDGNNAGR